MRFCLLLELGDGKGALDKWSNNVACSGAAFSGVESCVLGVSCLVR